MKLNEVKKGKSVADLGIEYKGGDFDCYSCSLTSLEGAPQEVDGYFACGSNQLTSLKGAPQKVGGNFMCGANLLTSLEGGLKKVGGDFRCSYNDLTSLQGAPPEVGGNFCCSNNNLTSLEGAPQKVGGNFYCSENKNLTSLKGIHRHIKQIDGSFVASQCSIQSHILGLLLIKGLKTVWIDNKGQLNIKKVQNIINAHLDGGSMRSAMDCQHELIKAGFSEYAQL